VPVHIEFVCSVPPHYNVLILGFVICRVPDVKLQRTNTVDKPVLDQGTFQQLLAAAYTLQEQNDHLLVKEAKADSPRSLPDVAVAEKVRLIPISMTPEPWAETELPLKSVLPMAQSDVEPVASLNDSVRHPETDTRVPDLAREVLEAASVKRAQSKSAELTLPVQHPVPRATSGSGYRMVRGRISQSNELFWKAATVVAMAAVSALLLGTSIDRLSPLPAGLALPSEVVQQQVPFRRATHIVTILAQSGGIGTKTIMMEPQATTTGPAEQTGVPEKATGGSATPASAKKAIVDPNRVPSAYESEADMVAPDTVVRYDARSAAPRVQVQKKP
jgi:hypothetical protein